MEFRLLGRLEAASNGDHLDIRRPKQRELLAMLLLEAGKVVATDCVDGGFIEDTRPAIQHLAQRIVSGEIRPPAVRETR